MTAEEEKAAEEAAKETAKVDETKAIEEEKARLAAEEAAKAKEAEKASETDADVFEIKNLKMDGEGNLVWILDPTDPKSTVYKGKTVDEVLENASKGVKEKDAYISKLKGQGLISSVDKKGITEKEALVNVPEYGQVLHATFKELGVDPAFLQLDDAGWKEIEEKHGVRKALQIENQVNRAKQIADQRYQELNVKSINDATLEEEEELVIEMLTEEGISEDDFADTYKKILTAVFEDPKNFNKQGVRKSGRVVNIARRAIKEMTSGKATDDAKKKAEEKIASERQIKATLLNARKTGKEFTKSDDKVFKNTEEVVEEILKDYRSKVK